MPARLDVERQRAAITDVMRARVAMAGPMLKATLFALKGEVVERHGGYAKIRLADLARAYREGDRDLGICFEYVVHDAIERRDQEVYARISEVLEGFCKIRGGARSILFGLEKGKTLELIASEESLLTPESRLLVGGRGQPIKLMKHLEKVTEAFRRPEAREQLPQSIRGLWRADQFVGVPEREQWVATSLKLNPNDLEGARGIRVGIHPERKPREGPSWDDSRRLVLCPLPYDGGFMECFHSSHIIVIQFLRSDARVPKESVLPMSADRYVAKLLEQRRSYPVFDVIAALEQLGQPDLLESSTTGESYPDERISAIAPVPRKKR